MHFLKTILGIMAFSLIVVSCSNDDDSNPSSSNNDIGTASDGEGVYALSGDVEMTGSGVATHSYKAAYTIDDVTFSIQTVDIIEIETNTYITVEFYVLDPEADMFSGKEPEEGTYKIYNPGLETPQEDYVKVNVYSDNFASFFTTDEESQIELIKHDNGIWEAEFENVLDDFQTDEVITINCNFKATSID